MIDVTASTFKPFEVLPGRHVILVDRSMSLLEGPFEHTEPHLFILQDVTGGSIARPLNPDSIDLGKSRGSGTSSQETPVSHGGQTSIAGYEHNDETNLQQCKSWQTTLLVQEIIDLPRFRTSKKVRGFAKYRSPESKR